MGQQHKKVVKRARRKAYCQRKTARLREERLKKQHAS